MKMAKPISAEDFRLQSSFESVRKTLLQARFADRLEKPLAYWALPNDRRLPIAFLGRTVGELLSTPFDELTATPGIGQKKIHSLVKLLHRATQDGPPLQPFGADARRREPRDNGNDKAPQAAPFDPSIVSEALWVQWRETVERFHLGDEKLGRLTPTLQSLPTVIWHTPLSHYLRYTLAEIRALKTHGEKRVRAVLEVFYEVNKVLSQVDPGGALAVRLAPRFVPPVEAWIARLLADCHPPQIAEVRERLAWPLVDQIRIDAGPMVQKLVEGRLGIYSAPQTVLSQSRQLGVTRARIYQLFDDCANIMKVRWPEGSCHLAKLAAKCAQFAAARESLALINSIRDLFYSDKREQREGNGMA